jgi:hypothetical protein
VGLGLLRKGRVKVVRAAKAAARVMVMVMAQGLTSMIGIRVT